MDIAIVGKGALGLLFGNIAQENLGSDHVCFVMDDERLDRHAQDTYTINGTEVRFRDVRASEAGTMDAVLVCTKSLGYEDALDLVEPLLGPDTVVVPLLNGITSERKAAERFGWERVAACVAVGMDAERYGASLVHSKVGMLVVGALVPASAAAAERAAEVLSAAGIPRLLDEKILHRQWVKFMANVGVNQVCAAYGVCYEELFADETSEEYRMLISTMREVMATGAAEGVTLSEGDMNGYLEILHSLDPKSRPSTAQDVANKALTEVDEFAGEVIRLAEKHGLEVPCNRYLFKRIREIEAAY